MNTLWHKIWADLWLSKARTLLAILSIAIGVFCVGTLYGMIDLELGKMDAAHRQSKPSHINLILRQDADLGLLPDIKALSGVSGIDTLSPLTVRYKLPKQSEWQIGTLIIRPETAKQEYDITTLSSGKWPSGQQIAIEQLSARHTGLKLGDQVEIETQTGSKALPIRGIVRHPFVKPPHFGGQVHFFADASLMSEFGLKPNSFRQLLVQVSSPYSADKARTIAHEIRNVLAIQHIAVSATLLQDPEQHWGRPFFVGINGVLKAMALVSLVLACVLIMNTLSAHIAQQTNQIGIMKSLGARIGTIANVYLAESLIMAIAAVILAIPLGLVAAYLSSCKMLALFNIDCNGFVYSQRAMSYMLLGGLFTPLIAALLPSLRGATLNIRQAIASYGLGGNFGNNRFDLWIERLGTRFFSTLNAAALGNLFRRKGRLLLTQSVLVMAGAMFLVLMSLIASVNLTLDNEMARSRYNVRLGFPIDQPKQKVLEVANSLASTQSIEFWQRLPIEMTKNGSVLRQKGSLGVQMLAVPALTQMYRPYIESGRWFRSEDLGKRVIVLSADTAELNGIKAGDQIAISMGSASKPWQVIGLYRWLAGNNFVIEPIYAPLETIKGTLPQDKVSFALFNTSIDMLAEENNYLQQLRQKFQDNNIRLDVYTTLAKLEQRQFARNQLAPVIATLFGLAALIASVGGIGLSGTLAIEVLQRTREIGVLRAIGAPATAIYRLFIMEGILHGFVAWLLSVPLAYLVAEPIAQELGKALFGIHLDFTFDTKAIGYWLVILILLALLASRWPAYKASRLSVKECLGN